MFDLISPIVTRIKQDNPLVLNITSLVTMDFIANGLLCVGASPIMSQGIEESADLMNICASVVINPGTLDEPFIKLSEQVCQLANVHKKPIVFDPVGAGASAYRTTTCKRILDTFKIAILRGNASEIMALAGHTNNTKGVDSLSETQYAIDSARLLAQKYQLTVVISGETDAIVDTHTTEYINYGSPLMPMITGTGCLLSAVVGAFQAVHSNPFEAATAATAFYGMCGTIAARHATKPGSFKVAFLDALYTLPNRDDYANN